jgi:O-antigen ligase
MSREVLDNWCERGILLLTLAILVFLPLAWGGIPQTPTGGIFDFILINPFGIAQALLLGVMLLWCARLWIAPKPKFLWPPVCWAVLAFMIYAIARYRTADIEYVARDEMICVLIYALLFFAIVNNLHRQESMQLIALTLIFLAMLVAAYAVFQVATKSNKVWMVVSPYGRRGTGTFISPNNCAGFLEMILPLGLAWVLVSRAKATLKVFVGYAALVTLAGIVATVSRGSWISVGLALIVFFSVLVFHHSYRLPSLAMLAVLICGGILMAPRLQFYKGRMKELTKNNQINSNARFDLWTAAVKMWETNPWWGVGPAHYDYRFREWRPVTEQLQPDRAHNDYVNTLADWGVVGLALIATTMGLLATGVIKTWGFTGGAQSDLGGRNSNKFALVLGGSMGLLAILVHSFVDFNMHIPANAVLAVTLMALLSCCTRFATDSYWFSTRLPAKIFGTIFLLVGIYYLGSQEILRAQEYHWLARAQRAASVADRAAALEKAFAVEPMNPSTAYELGEVSRSQSWEGNDDYAELAEKAMQWYARGMKLNPYDGYNYMRTGMCLDWIGQHEKAAPFFDRGIELDPNGNFMTANVGWHYTQINDYAAAKVWFERSLHLSWDNNTIAESYLKICDQKLRETAEKSAPDARPK